MNVYRMDEASVGKTAEIEMEDIEVVNNGKKIWRDWTPSGNVSSLG
jgi:hypothetical protein